MKTKNSPPSKSELTARNRKYINSFMSNPLVLGTAAVLAITMLLMLISYISVGKVDNPESPYFETKFKDTPYMSFVMVTSPLTQIAIIASFFVLHYEAKKPSTAKAPLPTSTCVLIISIAICLIDTVLSFSYESLFSPTVDKGVSALFHAFSKDTTVEDPIMKLSFISSTDMFHNIGMLSLFRTLTFTAFAVSVIVSQLTPYFAGQGCVFYAIFCFIMIFPSFFFFILSFYPYYYPAITPGEPHPVTGKILATPDYFFIAQRLFAYIGYLLQTILALKFFSKSLSAGWLGRKIKDKDATETTK